MTRATRTNCCAASDRPSPRSRIRNTARRTHGEGTARAAFLIESSRETRQLRGMKIEISGTHGGAYCEVGFVNSEDEEIVAYSGLLGPTEASELSGQLRDLAQTLSTWAGSAQADEQ